MNWPDLYSIEVPNYKVLEANDYLRQKDGYFTQMPALHNCLRSVLTPKQQTFTIGCNRAGDKASAKKTGQH